MTSSIEIVHQESGKTTLVFHGGELDGDVLKVDNELHGNVAAPIPRYRDLTETEQRQSEQTAASLLHSILKPWQQYDYVTTGGFFVPCFGIGYIRLGTIYSIFFETSSATEHSHSLICVMPQGDIGLTPPSDIWSNLLIALHNDASEFINTANVMSCPAWRDSLGPDPRRIDTRFLPAATKGHYVNTSIECGARFELEIARRSQLQGANTKALTHALASWHSFTVAQHERQDCAIPNNGFTHNSLLAHWMLHARSISLQLISEMSPSRDRLNNTFSVIENRTEKLLQLHAPTSHQCFADTGALVGSKLDAEIRRFVSEFAHSPT